VEIENMEDVSLAHAKDHLEELIARASRGEDVRISDPDVGTVRLLPVANVHTSVEQPGSARYPGRLKGKLTVPTRLLEPMSEEELKLWYGDSR
jgi:antitoxin (DNA-binding transcriptional repressor) of toxin-antitoxin stability system